VRVKGHTFWRAASGGRETELTSETGIELDADRCRWTVIAPGGTAGVPVESRSREVHHFMLGVVEQMHRATRQAMRRPVPKPAPKAEPPMPTGAPWRVRCAGAKPGTTASCATGRASLRSGGQQSGRSCMRA